MTAGDTPRPAEGPVRIGVTGAAGRMGRMLIQAVLDTADGSVALHGAVEHEGSAAIGQDAGLLAGRPACGITVSDDPVQLFATADAVVDFTRPEASVRFSALAAQGKAVHVVGTTGFSAEQLAALGRAARHTPVIQSFNMSLGVNLLAALVRQAARALDAGWDIEVVEMHHRHKIDAPSGTAILLGRAAAEGREVDFDAVKAIDRDGRRPEGAIGFATLRGGDVVGEHSVILAGAGERIELTHKATDRGIFARGALKAALWGRGRAPGLYSMTDVLGLS
ncbi:4-hydroxy-tetrahydrodipicolinate reductase [Inquilinus limosus]|uniref:4-hydroxy-tetrahydrodipicolinate reductase n=1 Tax=Inquilinus limosus TaxID=171674 RepID=A0A211ZN40_9PROT|nr:4-hydroxy-tetrahydrodipicolinate reductase [Inquilinus limosus]OWJ66606.1 4-hydroxy-tetrahydrodipicolinate reductase [Inquilinus limosus]